MRLYKLDTQTGHIINLIDELALHYPLGSHERQEHSHAFMRHQINALLLLLIWVRIELSHMNSVIKDLKKVQYHNLMMQMGLVISHFITMDNMRMWYMNYQIISVTTYQNGEFHELERHSTIPEQMKRS